MFTRQTGYDTFQIFPRYDAALIKYSKILRQERWFNLHSMFITFIARGKNEETEFHCKLNVEWQP